jgi:hypothetical protein
VVGLGLAAAGIAFFFIVWLIEQVQLPALGLAPPGWTWGAKAVAIDLWHHIAFAAATVAGWVLLGVVG